MPKRNQNAVWRLPAHRRPPTPGAALREQRHVFAKTRARLRAAQIWPPTLGRARPSWKHTTQPHIGGPPSYSERLSGRAFSNFPDKPIVIKMQERRSSHHAGENAFNRIHTDMRI